MKLFHRISLFLVFYLACIEFTSASSCLNRTCVDCFFASSDCVFLLQDKGGTSSEGLCLNRSSLTGDLSSTLTSPLGCPANRQCTTALFLPFVVSPCDSVVTAATLFMMIALVCLGGYLGCMIHLKHRLYGLNQLQFYQALGCGFCGSFIFAEDPQLLQVKRVCAPCARALPWFDRLWIPTLSTAFLFLLWFAGHPVPVFLLTLFNLLFILASLFFVFRSYLQLSRIRQSELRADIEMVPVSAPHYVSGTRNFSGDPDQSPDSQPILAADALAPSDSPSPASPSSETSSASSPYPADAFFPSNTPRLPHCDNEQTALVDEPIFTLTPDHYRAYRFLACLVLLGQLVFFSAFAIANLLGGSVEGLPAADLYAFDVKTEFALTWVVLCLLLMCAVAVFQASLETSAVTLRRVVVTNRRAVFVYRQCFSFDVQRSVWHADVERLALSDHIGDSCLKSCLGLPTSYFTVIGNPSVNPYFDEADASTRVDQLDGRPLSGIEVFALNDSVMISHLRRMPDVARLIFQHRNRERTVVYPSPHPFVVENKYAAMCGNYCMTLSKWLALGAILFVAVIIAIFAPPIVSIITTPLLVPGGAFLFGFFTVQQITMAFSQQSTSIFSPISTNTDSSYLQSQSFQSYLPSDYHQTDQHNQSEYHHHHPSQDEQHPPSEFHPSNHSEYHPSQDDHHQSEDPPYHETQINDTDEESAESEYVSEELN